MRRTLFLRPHGWRPSVDVAARQLELTQPTLILSRQISSPPSRPIVQHSVNFATKTNRSVFVQVESIQRGLNPLHPQNTAPWRPAVSQLRQFSATPLPQESSKTPTRETSLAAQKEDEEIARRHEEEEDTH